MQAIKQQSQFIIKKHNNVLESLYQTQIKHNR
jgi:hypothetical protein